MFRGLKFAGSKAFVGLSAAISTTAATATAVIDAEAKKGQLIANGTRLFSKDNILVLTAQLCAYLCDRIYLPYPGCFDPMALGFDCNVLLANFSEQRSLGYCTNFAVMVSHSQRRLYVVFRGSTNIYDWLVNFEALPTPFLGNVNLHKGVYTALEPHYREKILPALVNALKTWPGYRLMITGHSLGGGYATALNLMFGRDQKTIFAEDPAVAGTVVELYTFAAPTIVHTRNKELAQQELAQMVNLDLAYNFVQHHDVVPRVLGGDYHANTIELLGRVANIKMSNMEEVKNYLPIGQYFFIKYKRVKVTASGSTEELPPVDQAALPAAEVPGTPADVAAAAVPPVVTKVVEAELWDVTSKKELLLELPMGLKGGRDCIGDHSMTLYLSNMCLV